ncbi:NAD(P)/FAD-dependent oxidoreductase [Streptomyces sp. SAS_269]|uniref:NAD(P)/FAD-dependent oxidoreductase n=1 Tax=Streptomyces sp. SAS_269 TaxID=3412749 RepID=UPI00403D34CA
MTANPPVRSVDVLVVGAGPAGLAAAARLAAAGAGRVEVLEREARPGGATRYCAQGGFGTWTRPLTGPGYARLLTEAAVSAGAVVRTGVTVLEWADAGPPLPATPAGPVGKGAVDGPGAGGAVAAGPGEGMRVARAARGGVAEGAASADVAHVPVADGAMAAGEVDGPGARSAASAGALGVPGPTGAARMSASGGSGDRPDSVLTVVGPGGLETVTARAVVLATGARERPRAARLVPGTRPAGVYTTGELQQAVHLFGQPIGTRAVVVGAEHVSYTAAGTLRAAGVTVAAQVTEQDGAQVPPIRAQSARLGDRIPLLTHTTVDELLGHGRLSGVRLRHRDGRTAVLPCDTIVFTGDFVADNELARTAGIRLDTSPYTSRPGVFAAGGLPHPGQRAAAATSDGVTAAGAVLHWLAGAPWPGT